MNDDDFSRVLIHRLTTVNIVFDDGVVTDQGNFILTHREKDELIARIEAFYSQYTDADIAEYNENKYKQLKSYAPELKKHTPKRNKQSGFIYLLQSGFDAGYYKIGLSRKVKDRLKQIGNAELLYSFPADDTVTAEGMLHNIFAHKRVFGEWFALSEDDIERITKVSGFTNGKFKGEFCNV